MRYIFTLLLPLLLLRVSGTADAQVAEVDVNLKRDFQAQVKSIDEFMARFNGEESKPGIAGTADGRKENIISLFDFRMSHGGLSDAAFRKKVLAFADAATAWNGRLTITSAGTRAEARCKIKHAGKYHHIILTMKMDRTTKGELRWAVDEISGLEKLGLYDEKRLTISPVDHETHFMSLQDFFQANHRFTPSMRSAGRKIDELSFFFGLCVAKAIDFIQVDELKFRFTDIPGYTFTVEEIGRQGTNSGWLITEFEQTDKNNNP